MGCGDDTRDVLLIREGDAVSSHTDTIRATDDEWLTQPTDLGGWANRAARMKQTADALLAENQRLREALEAALPYIDSDGAPPGEAERVYELGREALAGDAE